MGNRVCHLKLSRSVVPNLCDTSYAFWHKHKSFWRIKKPKWRKSRIHNLSKWRGLSWNSFTLVSLGQTHKYSVRFWLSHHSAQSLGSALSPSEPGSGHAFSFLLHSQPEPFFFFFKVCAPARFLLSQVSVFITNIINGAFSPLHFNPDLCIQGSYSDKSQQILNCS